MTDATTAVRHDGNEATAEMVSIPVTLLQSMREAVQAFEELQDELEDYLLSHDTDFLARMRQARAHHLEGGARSLHDLKQELCIE